MHLFCKSLNLNLIFAIFRVVISNNCKLKVKFKSNIVVVLSTVTEERTFSCLLEYEEKMASSFAYDRLDQLALETNHKLQTVVKYLFHQIISNVLLKSMILVCFKLTVIHPSLRGESVLTFILLSSIRNKNL